MNYINAMKKLKQFEEKRTAQLAKLSCPYNAIKSLENKRRICKETSVNNLTQSTRGLIEAQDNNCMSPRLMTSIEEGCKELEINCSNEIKKSTTAYERNVSQIHRDASEEIKKGAYVPLSENAPKIMGLLVTGCAALVFLMIFPLAFGSMLDGPLIDGEKASSVMRVLGFISLGLFFLILCYKKKSDPQKLSDLATRLKSLTTDYVNLIYPIFQAAYDDIKARSERQIDALTDEIRTEIGDSIFDLYENTPLGQREYFLKLGMTAASETDFNEIARECIKAEEERLQIALRHHLATEAQKEMTKKIDNLKRTAEKMQMEAEIKTARVIEQNDEIAKQNERYIKNQEKLLEELKKKNN